MCARGGFTGRAPPNPRRQVKDSFIRPFPTLLSSSHQPKPACQTEHTCGLRPFLHAHLHHRQQGGSLAKSQLSRQERQQKESPLLLTSKELLIWRGTFTVNSQSHHHACFMLLARLRTSPALCSALHISTSHSLCSGCSSRPCSQRVDACRPHAPPSSFHQHAAEQPCAVTVRPLECVKLPKWPS